MPTALVTGATGLVGSHVVERMLADGWRVRALVRDRSAASLLESWGADLRVGDVLDATSFAGAASGCDAIVHAAAAITPRGGVEEYRSLNVGGTNNAIEAARAAGARLLHVSSVAVYGGATRYSTGGKTDESVALQPLAERNHYGRSKRDSERLVLDAHREGRIWASAVRPCVVYGPRDRQYVPRLARLLSLGVAPIIGSGRSTLAVVHAANVADGIVRALGTDAAGGRAYNLANDFDVTVEEFFRLALRGLGRTPRVIHIPGGVARGAISMMQVVDRAILGGRFSVATSGSIDFMTKDNPFTSERARSELGWDPPVDPKVGVPEAFRAAR